jgi:L-iditol 2-dehydrogenase
MKAAVFSGVGKIETRERETPRIGDSDILLKVGAATMCGTDLKILGNGHFKIREGEQRILGHEFAGEIVEIGRNVVGYRKGQRVAVGPNVGCGTCRYCRMGKTHLCPDYDAFGISRDGAFAEYVLIHDKAIQQGNLVPIAANLSFEEAALAEPLSCCYNAWRSVDTRPGDAVLIVGLGPMGILHLQLQKLAGAGTVMVADIAETRLGMAEAYGADLLINSAKEGLEEAVLRSTGGIGADVVITAVPVPAIQQQSVRLAARQGRINLFGGLPKGKELVEIDTNLIHYRGIVLTGTTGASLEDYERSLRLIEQGKIDVASLITGRYPLAEIRAAFEYAGSGRGLKTLIETG